MKVIALLSFPIALDGITVETMPEGKEFSCPDDIVSGLEDAGLVMKTDESAAAAKAKAEAEAKAAAEKAEAEKAEAEAKAAAEKAEAEKAAAEAAAANELFAGAAKRK